MDPLKSVFATKQTSVGPINSCSDLVFLGVETKIQTPRCVLVGREWQDQIPGSAEGV